MTFLFDWEMFLGLNSCEYSQKPKFISGIFWIYYGTVRRRHQTCNRATAAAATNIPLACRRASCRGKEGTELLVGRAQLYVRTCELILRNMRLVWYIALIAGLLTQYLVPYTWIKSLSGIQTLAPRMGIQCRIHYVNLLQL